ncbi:UNVERIFIED_CONTAM: hypothetical protein FKN15_026241 [Acipenser sinensis]
MCPIAWRSLVRVQVMPSPIIAWSSQGAAHNWLSAARVGRVQVGRVILSSPRTSDSCDRSVLSSLTATTPALTREGEDEHMLSSEACAISRPLFSPTLRTHHAATQERQEDNAALRQFTDTPAGARPDYRGRWCPVRRGPHGRRSAN